MTSRYAAPPGHPIVGFAARLHGVLDELAGVATWSMTAGEQRSGLVEIGRGLARLEELRLRVLAAAEATDVAAETAATSTGAWLAQATRCPRGVAVRDVKVAVALDGTCEVTRVALAAGRVDAEQARVIVHAVSALVRDAADAVAADPGVVGRAEAYLVAAAADHDAVELKALGRHVLEVLDPDAADARVGARLEAEERAADRATFLETAHNPDGTVSGRFKIPLLHAAMLDAAVEAFTNPRHRHAATHGTDSTGTGTGGTGGIGGIGGDCSAGSRRGRRSRAEVRGQGFCELLERLDPTVLPQRAGRNATIVVQLDLEVLLTGIGTATLDTGEQLSAATARRLFCESGIVPAVYKKVLGGPSVVLDLGREQRFHTRHQRLALTVRDRGCTTQGCDRPAGRCHAHHDTPWSQGGATSLENGRLLCGYHHSTAHSPAYDMQHLPDGQVRFHRRT